jgi:hypothetical protein
LEPPASCEVATVSVSTASAAAGVHVADTVHSPALAWSHVIVMTAPLAVALTMFSSSGFASRAAASRPAMWARPAPSVPAVLSSAVTVYSVLYSTPSGSVSTISQTWPATISSLTSAVAESVIVLICGSHGLQNGRSSPSPCGSPST